MNHTEPTRSTREFLRAQAGTNAKLRRLLKGVSAKQKREAKARAGVREKSLQLKAENEAMKRGRV